MKNQITLSLITAAILGLNGCGGSSKSTVTSDNDIKSSSVQKLSEASTKHTQTEWIAIENAIQALDNTEGFNTMLLDSIEKNVATLNYVGIDKEMAYATNSDAMFDDLTELDIEDLDNQVVAECKENDICKEEAYASLDTSLLIDKEMAYAMAEDFRGDEKSLVNDKLVKEFTCETGLTRTVKHYGIEDVFSTTNGVEATQQNPASITQGMLDYNSNVNAGFANYDETHNDRLFLDNIDNLPAGITSGRFYIGLKSNGSSLQVNDTMSLGDMSQPVGNKRFSSSLSDLSTTHNWSNQLVNNSNPTTDIYWSDFSNITMGSQTFLDYMQTTNRFDAYVQDDTSVDFITVATCSKPDPIKEVTSIVNKFECSEKETLVKILGGEIDNFTPIGDANNPANPRPALSTLALGNTVYPTLATYDYTSYDYHFVDTLELNGTLNGGTVTKAQFNIGYKVIGSSLHSNDALYIGDVGTSYVGGHFYDTTSPLSGQNWVQPYVTGYGYVAQRDFDGTSNTLPNNSGTGNVFDTMLSNNYLDVYVQDDTAVDFTQLNLCVKDNCDESAKEHNIDLSQLSSWTTQATDVQENNPIPNTWDNTLNWFEFTSKEANGQRVLEIPFCACSNTIVNINNLKADNNATIKLDGTLVASQQAAGQAAMKADSNGGNHEDGTLTLPAGTTGGTDHVLRVDVTNQTLQFGVAIDGTLNFKGNLGKCN